MNKKNLRAIAALLGMTGMALLATSCHPAQEADEMQVYSYKDTLFALQPLHQDTALQFYAPVSWPVDTVVLDTLRYFDSLVKRPIFIFNSSLQLPVPTRHKEIAFNMNDTISRLALSENRITPDSLWPQVFEPHVTPDTLMGRLYRQLLPVMRNNMPQPRSSQSYYFGVSGNFAFFSDKVLTYRLRYSQYTLGAHGNHRTQYLVFDLNSGKPMQENELFVQSDECRQGVAALLREAYEEFLANDTVDRQGMTWDTASLTMTGIFAGLEDGIVYHYDPYEAGPYALGSLELKLLSYKLQPYIDESSPVYTLWFK